MDWGSLYSFSCVVMLCHSWSFETQLLLVKEHCTVKCLISWAKICDAMTYPCANFNGSFVNPASKLGMGEWL